MNKHKSIDSISEEALIAEYAAVYHYVLALCKDDSVAQEITQETFFRAIKSAGQFHGNSSLYTWLCTIAKNYWLNLCKAGNRETILTDSISCTECSDPSPEETVLQKDISMQIHMVLHNLQEPYKEVFSLRVFGQLSFQEISRLFGKTESWARVTYHRARSMIQNKMRKGDFNG